ncbi:MAG: hypothetical protein DME24_07395 [Verrucomicrobia bacterium]|nr:MAG: hypothetical protein DME24_07395 [Verrucomicrobiota bacterium]
MFVRSAHSFVRAKRRPPWNLRTRLSALLFKNTLPDASVGSPRTDAAKNLVTRQNGSYRYLPERDHLRITKC